MFLALSLSSEMILNGSVRGDLELFLQLFSPHLEFSCLANFNSLVESSTQIWYGIGITQLVDLGERLSMKRIGLHEMPPPTPHTQRSECCEECVCVSVCVRVCCTEGVSLLLYILSPSLQIVHLKLQNTHIHPPPTHTHTGEVEFWGLVTVSLPDLEHRRERELKCFLWGKNWNSEGNFQFSSNSGCRRLSSELALLWGVCW